ncbi:hypothetical protein Gogos_021179 [Gossypium gossypioides]|uniref:Uncharacterized protein n=1 Tax=Gossypium gossypioides TaxID=34282 RepID=A0A7J9D4P9_GOSGO|nr:hypothetical protein [Gossypium gossypioides]
MKRFTANSMWTLEYDWWWGKRINDNVPLSNQESIQPIEEHLQVISSELEILKQDFGKKKKGKNKAKEDLDSLKTDYKKLRLSIRTTGLEKMSGKWEFLKSQDEKVGLRARVAKLEWSLHQHRSRNSMTKLKAGLTKIDELKRKIE